MSGLPILRIFYVASTIVLRKIPIKYFTQRIDLKREKTECINSIYRNPLVGQPELNIEFHIKGHNT